MEADASSSLATYALASGFVYEAQLQPTGPTAQALESTPRRQLCLQSYMVEAELAGTGSGHTWPAAQVTHTALSGQLPWTGSCPWGRAARAQRGC